MEGVRQKVVAHWKKKLRLVEYSKAMPPHWCSRSYYGYILTGRLEIEFADGTDIFEGGSGLFIPDGPQHGHCTRKSKPASRRPDQASTGSSSL